MTLGDFFYPGVRSAARSGVYWSSGDWAEISLGSSGAAIIVGLEFGESRGPGFGVSGFCRVEGFRVQRYCSRVVLRIEARSPEGYRGLNQWFLNGIVLCYTSKPPPKSLNPTIRKPKA